MNYLARTAKVLGLLALIQGSCSKSIDQVVQAPVKIEEALPQKIIPQKTIIKKETIPNYDVNTDLGRFLRTLRWDYILTSKELEYGLPSGLLGGLAMRESYGDPLRLNGGDDGGAGLFQIQPGMARAYGLKVFSTSKAKGRDKKHGKKLDQLVEKEDLNYGPLADRDDRFNAHKATDAAARILRDEYKALGSWDLALAAYNAGRERAKHHINSNHVIETKRFQQIYNDNKKVYVLQ